MKRSFRHSRMLTTPLGTAVILMSLFFLTSTVTGQVQEQSRTQPTSPSTVIPNHEQFESPSATKSSLHLISPYVAGRINLTPNQLNQIGILDEELHAEIATMRSKFAEINTKFEKVLTTEQLAKLKEVRAELRAQQSVQTIPRSANDPVKVEPLPIPPTAITDPSSNPPTWSVQPTADSILTK